MNTYLAGTPVQLAVSFTDSDGNPLSVTSATYRIVDDNSTEIQASTSFDTTQTTLTIASELNQIAAIDLDALTYETMELARLNEARIVEFEVTLEDGNIQAFDFPYIIVPRERLITGLNSFQTLREAYLTSMSIPGTAAWTAANEDERVAAMIEARLRICTFRFEDVTVGQAYLGESHLVGNLSLLPPREFKRLTPRFVKALKLAQLAEAEEILGGGDQSTLYRRNGLTSQTIGETQETYRTTAPLDMRLSKTALRYLGQYISLNKKIGRAG